MKQKAKFPNNIFLLYKKRQRFLFKHKKDKKKRK